MADVAERRDLARIRQGQQQFIRAHGLAHYPLGMRRRERQGREQKAHQETKHRSTTETLRTPRKEHGEDGVNQAFSVIPSVNSVAPW
jgi:hypothetical protein